MYFQQFYKSTASWFGGQSVEWLSVIIGIEPKSIKIILLVYLSANVFMREPFWG